MRTKVIMLASKYMIKAMLSITLFVGTCFLFTHLIGKLTDDKELAFIVYLGLLALTGLFAVCYDMAKNKIDRENNDLKLQLSRKQ